MLAGIIPPYLPHHSQLFNNKFQLVNPFHITSLFLSFLMFSGGIERDQWHEMGHDQYSQLSETIQIIHMGEIN